MEDKFKYVYDPSTRILYKYYYGAITLKDICSSWDYAISNKIIPEGTRSFILDYRDAYFDMKLKEHRGIADYYKKHLDVFGNCKIAIITQTPEDVVIPTLVELIDDGYYSQPFYTLEAAVNWVLS